MSRLRGLLLRASIARAFALLLLRVGSSSAQTSPVEAVDGPLPAAKAPGDDNDSVMKMAKAGLGDDLIVQTINAQPGQYTTDADALVALKEAGVSDRVITAWSTRAGGRFTERAPRADRALRRQ